LVFFLGTFARAFSISRSWKCRIDYLAFERKAPFWKCGSVLEPEPWFIIM